MLSRTNFAETSSQDHLQYQSALVPVRQRVQELDSYSGASSVFAAGKQPADEPPKEPRPRTVRVTCLPAKDPQVLQRELEYFILEQLGKGPGEYSPIVTIVPCCDPNDPHLEALLDFPTNDLPKFLSKLRSRNPETVAKKFTNGRNIYFDTHFHGFTQLFYPETAVADVIAVGGIDGHAYGSWTSRQESTEMWLRHFFEEDTPRLRVMVYGYNTKLAGHAGGNLEQYVQRFMSDLTIVRGSEQTQRRPLFFITHSFGGILVMRALVRAKQAEGSNGDPAILSLYKATYGFVFFAVPHGGIDFREMTEELEKEGHPLVPLLHEISTKSTLLKQLSGDFKNLIQGRKVLSFIEGNADKSLCKNAKGQWERSGPVRQTLDSAGSVLSLPDSTEMPVTSFDKNHSTIAKLDRIDSEYKITRQKLRQWERDGLKHVANEFSKPLWGPVPSDNIPYARDKHFVGREDIMIALERKLNAGNHCRAGLIGFGGMGKSQIAIEYAHRFRAAAADTWVFWVKAGAKDSFEHSYYDMFKMQTGAEAKQGEDVLGKVYDWLREVRNGWWLMILDGADDVDFLFEQGSAASGADGRFAEQYSRPLIDLIPQAPHGKVLVTSRTRRSANRIVNDNNNIVKDDERERVGNDENSNVIKVNPMTEPESHRLLRSRIPGSSMDEVTLPSYDESRLVRLLECIPLAVSQAGAYIGNSESSIDEYVKMFVSNEVEMEKTPTLQILQQDLGDLRRDQKLSKELMDNEGKKPHAVVNTWRISFRVIQEKHPLSVELLAFISFYHHQAIPQYLLQRDWDNSVFETALAPLLDFDFVTRALNGDIDLHNLVQLVTRDWLKLQNTLEQYRVDALKEMVRHFPDGKYDSWNKCRQLFKHAQEVGLSQGHDRTRVGLEHGILLERTAAYFCSRGSYKWAFLYARGAVEHKILAVPEDHYEVVKSKILRADIFLSVGNWRTAEDLLRECMSIILCHPTEPEYVRLGGSLITSLRTAILEQGFYQDALKTSEVVYEKAVQLWGSEDPKSDQAAIDLALVYREAERWQAAESLLLHVLESQKRIQAAKHPRLLSIEMSLASLYHATKRYDEAEEIYVKTAAYYSEIYGELAPNTLTCRSSYAAMLLDAGRIEEGERLCREVLQEAKIQTVDESNLVFKLQSSLAMACGRQGKWEEGERLLRTVIKGREKTEGQESFAWFRARWLLAVHFLNKGEFKTAEKELRELVKHPITIVYPEHLHVLEVREALAIAWMNLTKFKKAIKLEKKVAASYHEQFGPEHRRTKEAQEMARKWQEGEDSLPPDCWPF